VKEIIAASQGKGKNTKLVRSLFHEGSRLWGGKETAVTIRKKSGNSYKESARRLGKDNQKVVRQSRGRKSENLSERKILPGWSR